MAAPLQAVRRFLRWPSHPNPTFFRSAFTARKNDPNNPNWVKVGLAFGSTVAIWWLLLKQHNEDLAEYERRKAEYERRKAEQESSISKHYGSSYDVCE